LAVISEFLREEQADGEIAQQQNGNQERYRCDGIKMHGDLPQFLTGLDVQKRQDKECGGEQQHDDILHCESPKPVRHRKQMHRPT
jgi:hypothetical protein